MKYSNSVHLDNSLCDIPKALHGSPQPITVSIATWKLPPLRYYSKTAFPHNLYYLQLLNINTKHPMPLALLVLSLTPTFSQHQKPWSQLWHSSFLSLSCLLLSRNPPVTTSRSLTKPILTLTLSLLKSLSRP